MPAEHKRKTTEKNPQKKRGERKQSRRVNAWSQRYLNDFSKNSPKKNPDVILGKVIEVHAGSNYDVQTHSGTIYRGVPLAGKARLQGKLHHNPEVKSLRVGNYVFMDGGQIAAVLDDHQAQNAREVIGWHDEADDFFNRGDSRSRSRSRSRSGSVHKKGDATSL